MKLNENYVIRDMAGITVLLSVNSDFQGIMAVNPVGARILEMIRSGVSDEAELLSGLCREYDAPQEEIEKDARAFLAELRENGIVLD